MQDFSFKKFVEQDIFGFGEKLPLEKQEDDLPIRSFSVHRVIERLNQHQLSLGKSKSKFLSEIQWGDQPGAIKVQFTPRLNVKIQKFHHDREGNDVWVLKRYFFVNDRDYAGNEESVADDVFEHVKAISEEGLEAVLENKEFKFENIVYSLAAKMRQQDNSGAIDFHGVTKLNENEYDLMFYVKGGGVGTTYGPKGQRVALALVVKMAYNESTGVIKAIAELIESVDDSTSWSIQPAEFDEQFLPTQDKNEIITSITTALRWF